MGTTKHTITVGDLPDDMAAPLRSEDILPSLEEAAAVKGGIRVGKNAGIRPLQKIRNVSGSSGDPGI